MEAKIFIVETVKDYCNDATFTDIDTFETRDKAIEFIDRELKNEIEEEGLTNNELEDIEYHYYSERDNQAFINSYGDLYTWKLLERTINL